MKKTALLGPLLALLSLIGLTANAAPASSGNSPVFSSAAVGSDNAGAITDDDGPDDGELTYSWQNAKYSRDERRQMGYILVFLSSLAIFSVLKPQRGRAPYPETETPRS